MAEVKYRLATQDDIHALLLLIQLGGKVKRLHGVGVGEEDLLRDGFGKDPLFKVTLVELISKPTPAKESVIGYALHFPVYSTWVGRVLCLQDLYIRQEHRDQGYEIALIKETAKIAIAKDCARMIWNVWEWETEATALYCQIGGKLDPDLLDSQLNRPNLCKLATSPGNDDAEIKLRQANEEDIDTLFGLVHEILEYFNGTMKLTKEDLLRDGFGEKPCFKVILAEMTSSPPNSVLSTPLPSSAGVHVAGYAMYYYTYSPWEGRVLFLQDIYVRGQYRSRGCGTAMMKEIAKIATDSGCIKISWEVLHSNTKARSFYERLGSTFVPELLKFHMDRPDLTKFVNLS